MTSSGGSDGSSTGNERYPTAAAASKHQMVAQAVAVTMTVRVAAALAVKWRLPQSQQQQHK